MMSSSSPNEPALSVSLPKRRGVRWLLVLALIGVSVAPLWVGLGDYPINRRSEGRYATASATMAAQGDWLVPHLGGKPHLTKPPLTYWAQALSIRVLGQNEWAVRLPSARAGTVVLLGVLLLGWRIGGLVYGLAAMCVLAAMPLHVVVSRLGLTDALLALWWFVALAGGYLAVERPGGRGARLGPALLWFGIALGLLTKGPVALTPLGVLVIWLGLGRRWVELKKLWWWGLPLALAPAIAWVVAVLQTHPDAYDIWRKEVLGRVVGEGAHQHVEPPWFYIPVFLGGLFPATAMMNLPPLCYSWRSAWQSLRRGTPACLWVLAVLVPLVMFSLISGKLATYILPLCPPMALLTATVLHRWLTGESDRPAQGRRPPEVRVALLLSFVGVTVGLGVYSFGWLGWGYWWLPAAALLAAGTALRMALIWRRQPDRRTRWLALVWVALMLLLGAGMQVMADYTAADSTLVALRQASEQTGIDRPYVVTFGYHDTTLPFYGLGPDRLAERDDLLEAMEQHGDRLVVIAEPKNWRQLDEQSPAVAERFERVSTWTVWPIDTQRWLLRLRLRRE